MEKAQIRSVASFFFFTLLDSNLAYKATSDAITLCKRELRKTNKEQLPNTFLIQTTYKIWKKYKDLKPKMNWEIRDIPNPFIVPSNVNLSPWRQFIKDEQTNVSLVVVWSRLLGFSEKDIAEGMGVSTGTVRYRAGKGLKALASELQPAVTDA